MAPPKSLAPEQLYRRCDPQIFKFETTAEVEELTRMVGQDRAVEAIQLGVDLDVQGYNLFVLGSQGTGRHSYRRQVLKQQAKQGPTPPDWCYVNNFEEARKPKALELPAGRGRKFREDIIQLIEEGRSAIPAGSSR